LRLSGGTRTSVSLRLPGVDYWPCEEECGHDQGDPDGGEDAGFYLPPVMQDSQADSDVDEFVKPVPALAAETAYPAGGGGERQRNEQQPCGNADGDEFSLGDVLEHGTGIEVSVEADVGEEVDGGVEEGEESEETAEFDEPAQRREELAQGRDGERDYQQVQGGVAGGELDVPGGVGAEVVGDSSIGQDRQRVEAGDPGERLEDDEGRFVHGLGEVAAPAR
jgi:hypothetical protein